MKKIYGIPISTGIAIGKAFTNFKEVQDDIVIKIHLQEDDIEKEIWRLDNAIKNASLEIENNKNYYSEYLSEDEINIFESHHLILTDQEMINRIKNNIKEQLLNAEYVTYTVTKEISNVIATIGDPYLEERANDIDSVSNLILKHLESENKSNFNIDLNAKAGKYAENVIFITDDLAPYEVISLNRNKIKGIILEHGGKTSHVAILAKSFKITSIFGVKKISHKIYDDDFIIMDGYEGCIIINPDSDTIEEYQEKANRIHKKNKDNINILHKKAVTLDNHRIFLKANIEIPEEVKRVIESGAEGIGLFRSEFLFIKDFGEVDEEKQFEVYSKVLKDMENKPVIIRTLDIGGDKMMSKDESKEKNSIMGWRAIRYCLSNLDIFKTQLRALLRASIYGNLSIMIPLITNLEEFNTVLEIIDEVSIDLEKENIEHKKDIPLGITIEVPSSVLIIDLLAEKSSFFSIGTNDLMQYILAVDRGNEKVAYLYDSYQPSIIRILKKAIDGAHEKNKKIAICGEIASDMKMTLILLGLGVDELSMAPHMIPYIKRLIRSCTLKEAKEITEAILSLNTSKEIKDFVEENIVKKYKDIFYNN